MTGAQAIHPGYGFLSENAEFARLCQRSGVTFIGPPPELMDVVGDKAKIKDLMAGAGVPVIPGTGILEDLNAARAGADAIGYPVMIKARSGGGGRGIRLVSRPDELENAFFAAQAEGRPPSATARCTWRNSSAPPAMWRSSSWPTRPTAWSSWESRDCSIQHRNQKLVEETPSPAVSPETREKLMEISSRRPRPSGT